MLNEEPILVLDMQLMQDPNSLQSALSQLQQSTYPHIHLRDLNTLIHARQRIPELLHTLGYYSSISLYLENVVLSDQDWSAFFAGLRGTSFEAWQQKNPSAQSNTDIYRTLPLTTFKLLNTNLKSSDAHVLAKLLENAHYLNHTEIHFSESLQDSDAKILTQSLKKLHIQYKKLEIVMISPIESMLGYDDYLDLQNELTEEKAFQEADFSYLRKKTEQQQFQHFFHKHMVDRLFIKFTKQYQHDESTWPIHTAYREQFWMLLLAQIQDGVQEYKKSFQKKHIDPATVTVLGGINKVALIASDISKLPIKAGVDALLSIPLPMKIGADDQYAPEHGSIGDALLQHGSRQKRADSRQFIFKIQFLEESESHFFSILCLKMLQIYTPMIDRLSDENGLSMLVDYLSQIILSLLKKIPFEENDDPLLFLDSIIKRTIQNPDKEKSSSGHSRKRNNIKLKKANGEIWETELLLLMQNHHIIAPILNDQENSFAFISHLPIIAFQKTNEKHWYIEPKLFKTPATDQYYLSELIFPSGHTVHFCKPEHTELPPRMLYPNEVIAFDLEDDYQLLCYDPSRTALSDQEYLFLKIKHTESLQLSPKPDRRSPPTETRSPNLLFSQALTSYVQHDGKSHPNPKKRH